MKVRTLKRQHNERTGSHLAAVRAAMARWADCLPGDYYDYDEQDYDDYDDELNCTHCGGEGYREVDDPLWDDCDEFGYGPCDSCNGTGLRSHQTAF